MSATCLHPPVGRLPDIYSNWGSDIPWKGVIFKCLYCGTFTQKFRCDSCGAPIQINHPKARVYANSHNYRFHS